MTPARHYLHPPGRGERRLPASVSMEAEATLEVLADSGHLSVGHKVATQSPAMGPEDHIPKDGLTWAQPVACLPLLFLWEVAGDGVFVLSHIPSSF